MLFFLKLNNRIFCKMLAVTSVLFLAFAAVTPVLQAQDWDHINGRDKVHDPTGAWLINSPAGFFLIVFHKGGTLTGNHQGESAFDPAATNPPMPDANVITSPQSGVWQPTGWNTFSAESLVIEYEVDAEHEDSPLFQFAKLQYTGKLHNSGDAMNLAIQVTHYNPDGTFRPSNASFNANGVRIPLEILPKDAATLALPTVPN
jgi:hypothetical protein